MSARKKKNKKPGPEPGECVRHGTCAYQKDHGGPSWDINKEEPPDTHQMMAIIERRKDDLELFRKFLGAIAEEPTMQSLSMIEMIDMAEMCMLQEKIGNWLLGVDDPDRLEEMRESNKMLRSIWQIKAKVMDKARERGPTGGEFEGLAKVLDEVTEDDMESESD